MFIRDIWYVGAWDFEIPAAGFFTRTILDIPILFYRREDGVAVAVEDRCCHRGAPLSAGRREGDRVRCGYHGLLFDETGACREIPGQAIVPDSFGVRAFALCERDRFVWIWMGDPALADPALIPDCHWQVDPGWRMLPQYLHYDANYELINDNLLDFSHLTFVHPTTLGTKSVADSKPVITRRANGLHIERIYPNDAPPPWMEKRLGIEAPVDRWQIYDWLLPGVFILDTGVAPVGHGAPHGDRAGGITLTNISIMTPETAGTTHYFWSHSHNFALDDPAMTAMVTGQVAHAFAEDKAIIETQQRRLVGAPDRRLLPIAADAALLQIRQLIEQRIVAEQARPVAGLAARRENAPLRRTVI
jgi:vanillate O-demethylase monooxygenase subunit